MREQNRDIFVTTDLDGILFPALTPLASLTELVVKKRISLPDKNDVLKFYQEPQSIGDDLKMSFHYLYNNLRPINKDGIPTFEQMMNIAIYHNRNIGFNVLSGREQHLHASTGAVLKKARYLELFGNDLFFNPGIGSALWKTKIVDELVGYGFNVVHLEDDIQAALSVAKLSTIDLDEQRVLVYLKNSLLTNEWLLRRANISLPSNIIPFNRLTEIPNDFRTRLDAGEI